MRGPFQKRLLFFIDPKIEINLTLKKSWFEDLRKCQLVFVKVARISYFAVKPGLFLILDRVFCSGLILQRPAEGHPTEHKLNTDIIHFIQIYPVSKNWLPLLLPKTSPNVDRFSNNFKTRLNNKRVMNRSLNIAPHLKSVATLPCET